MPSDGYNAKQASTTGSGDPASETGNGAGRRTGFECCGMRMDDAMARSSCASTVRRHPFVTSAILAVMGLAALVIPAGAVLGIIAFFRTF